MQQNHREFDVATNVSTDYVGSHYYSSQTDLSFHNYSFQQLLDEDYPYYFSSPLKRQRHIVDVQYSYRYIVKLSVSVA